MENGRNRREFLKLTGVAAVGIGCGGPILAALAKEAGKAGPGADVKGPRWAMVVDTKKCRHEEGCRECIDACHKVHNVPDIGTKKEEVKWIWKEPFEKAFPSQEGEYLMEELRGMPTLLLCNHCENPPCVRVCPTQSTWRREDGIVMMDMHRCIGCRYCIVACPYGSRSFNWRDPRPYVKEVDPEYPTRTRGVVEKCNFCADRMARGEMTPACVEKCPERALVFGDIHDPASEVRKILRERYTLRRKVSLGTDPHVFYVL